MPTRSAFVRLVVAVVLMSPTIARAQSAPASTSFSIPRLIDVSSAFQPADGQPPAGVEVVTLSIYADPEGGLPVWQETQSVVPDQGGRFNVRLGATHPDGIPPQVFASGEPRWMSMLFKRAGEVERPRVRMTTAPSPASKAAGAVVQGFNNPTREYRINTIATNPSIDFMTARRSRPSVAASDIGSGTMISQGNLNVGGASNFVGNVYMSGNLDLGSYGTNPAVRLNVGGPSAGTSIETAPVMQLSRPAQSGIKNTNSAGLSVGAFEPGILGRTRLDVKLSGLPTDSNTYGTIPDVTVMSMLADGRVGIGTTDPVSRLEVKDGSSTVTNGNVAVTNGNVAITNGTLKMTGAGANTPTAAFIHVVTSASHTCSAGQTIIDNPYTNNDPNAILIVTQNVGTTNPLTPVSDGAFFVRYGDQNVGCALFGGLNKWMIYSFGTIPVGSRFNVMVIKP